MSSPLPLRLNNVYAKVDLKEKLTSTVSKPHYDYFVRHVLAGEYGSVQAIISQFWYKFYEHCANVEKIPACWNIDGKNSQRLAEILSRLNFEDVGLLLSTIADLTESNRQRENELAQLRPIRPRRSNPSPAKPKKQPLSSNGNKRGTRSGRSKVPDVSSTAEGTEGRSNGEGKPEAEGKESLRQ